MKKRFFLMLVVFVIVSLLFPAFPGAEAAANTSGLYDATRGSGSSIQADISRPDSHADAMRVSLAPQTGKARFVWLTLDQAAWIKQKAGSLGKVDEQANVFFGRYGALFGVQNASLELVLSGLQTDALGNTHISYQQVYQGVPVFAGILRVHYDAQGLITTANGTFIPDIALDTSPNLNGAAAAELAVADIHSPGAAALGSTLYVYRENLARGIPGANYLVYEIEVSDGLSLREFIYVDAHTGAVIDRIAGSYETITRMVYNQVYDPANLLWQEGDPLPFISADLTPLVNQDVNNLINISEDTYQMMANATWGTYLSYDGADATMHQVVDVQIPDFCPNAQWTGKYARFCAGVAVDDIVAHEWSHAYTQFTDKLVYAWQPGAINESYSDIYGELVDLINGAGTDEPGGLRTDGACSVYTPLQAFLRVFTPDTIAGDYEAGIADFGPDVDGTLQGSLMIVDDGTGDTATEGCFPLINDLTGKIALIRRGTCTFVEKVKNAQNAGAIGAIIANHATGGDELLAMGGADPTITIQSLFIGYTDGNTIQAEIETGADVTAGFATIPPAVQPDDSYRWLMGEDYSIWRDMWNPTCYLNPDKVTSPFYACSTEDRGGVHSNSGVPNHAFALLVDGGSFNGQTIQGIGMNKAFQFYWRAQFVYQVPSSIFADHADALQQSCTDLIGVEAPDLITGLPSGEVVTSADCDELGKVVLAVEFYEDPVCTGTPMATYQYQININR